MGRFGMSSQFIPTASGPRAAGGGGGGGGGVAVAYSAKQSYDNGNRQSTADIIIGSGTFTMEFDPSDRYGTGDYGWARYNNSFFGANYNAISHTEYGQPGSIQPAWNVNSSSSSSNNNIGQGQHRIGREQDHQGGNSLSTIRVRLPYLTKARYSMSAYSGGWHTADCCQFTQNFSGIINNSPYQNNGCGYWAVVWSGSSGSWGNDMLIMDPGNWCSGNGNHSNSSSVQSFGYERNTSPWLIWGTTDAYGEYRYTYSWDLWIH